MTARDYYEAILPHLGTLLGFILAFIVIARLMREKRRPSNTFAWLLLILLVPYLGVPLFLLFGGRKIEKLSEGKGALNLANVAAESPFVQASPFGLISRGNRTQFLPTGIEAFEELVSAIRNAKESIEITTFILSHDAIGRRIVKELSLRAKQGIKVRLLLDAIGSFGKKTLYMLELEKAGGQIERFMPVFPIAFPGAANLRNHRKIALFDREKAIIGGRNIGREYMGPATAKKRWTDLGVVIEGPAVDGLAAIFDADWSFASRKRGVQAPLPKRRSQLNFATDSHIEIMASGPDTSGDPVYEKIISVIQEAERSITIVTPYFIPDEVLMRSLIVKARTGKRVRLIIPKRSNHRIVDLASRHNLRELHAAGIEIMLFTSGMMHGKALLVDERIAMTGSANMDLRSLFMNYEVAAFFTTTRDILAINHWIEGLMENCRPMEDTDYIPKRLTRRISEELAQLVAPLL